MTPTDLSEEDLAALSAYEAEGTEAEPEAESPAALLTSSSGKPRDAECRQDRGFHQQSSEPRRYVAVQLDVPREFIRLTEFLEQNGRRLLVLSRCRRPRCSTESS